MKSIYTFYKERLIEISGRNRCLFTRSLNRKNGYDIGKLLGDNEDRIQDFLNCFWKGQTYSYSLISPEERKAIGQLLHVEEIINSKLVDPATLDPKFEKRTLARNERIKREEEKKIVSAEISSIRALKREIDDIEKETGRYELFIGYPFVYGSLRDVVIKAPLILFPVEVSLEDENTVELSLKKDDHIQLNKAFLFAYAQERKIKMEEINTEFDNLEKAGFADIDAVLNYLKTFGFKINYSPRKSIFTFDHYEDPKPGDSLEVRNLCVLARYTLANSIYNDYATLEKSRDTNEAINELLNTKPAKKHRIPNKANYIIHDLDYAQQNVISEVNENGNMVIYGPPGTGKSQTIVSLIADSICKDKKVLVVSQKKAALDVVFNRLGEFSNKAMLIVDSEKEKRAFYDKCLEAHQNTTQVNMGGLQEKYDKIAKQIEEEENNLIEINNILSQETDFGISLSKMYSKSFMIGKYSSEYNLYQELQKNTNLMNLNYQELSDTLRIIKEKNSAELYYNYIEEKNKNPLIDHIKDSLSLHEINQTKTELDKMLKNKLDLFDMGKYPYSRQVLAYYMDSVYNTNLKPLIKMIVKLKNPKLARLYKTSCFILPMYPFVRPKFSKKVKEISESFATTSEAINEYLKDYSFLKNVLTEEGYMMVVDNVLNGNISILRMLLSVLENYVELRDIAVNISKMSEHEITVLKFAYRISNTYAKYTETISKILPIRIYHEVIKLENENGLKLAKLMEYDSIKNRIISLRQELIEVSREITRTKLNNDYATYFENAKDNKDYLYQISKKQNYWPIRNTMDVYGEYLMRLFPCWLLAPENVSQILPLKKDMFDIILFDEASQIFIENTLPTIYRGKTIVVAGDSKQLRPTATFMKRYLGGEYEELDYSTQAALEVESLLDLAISRFSSTNLTYHYRSNNDELIDFSNRAFYDEGLQISPNSSKHKKDPAIVRIKVDGKWINRKNKEEADKVLELLKKILKTRKNDESIGIVSFNSEQTNAIEDLIDKESLKDEEFRSLITKEYARKDANGEDCSFFIKNLENVQGDERDIIIFSVGYARNELGKIIANFGPLSSEGGENRLNVAITRAKTKIYVVTSIEPEELKVDGTKNLGPKIFKKYLQYARAVSNGNEEEVNLILKGMSSQETRVINDNSTPLELRIKTKLEKLGYTVETDLGNKKSKISLAIYDKELDRYLVGVETEYDAIKSSDSVIERDVYKKHFLESRGWSLIRVWNRDWWTNHTAVINNIVRLAEKNRAKLLKAQGKNVKIKSYKAVVVEQQPDIEEELKEIEDVEVSQTPTETQKTAEAKAE